MHCLLYARPCSGCVTCIMSFDSYNSTRELGYNINIYKLPHFTGKDIGVQSHNKDGLLFQFYSQALNHCAIWLPQGLFSPKAQHPRLFGFMQHELCISTKACLCMFFSNQTLSSTRPNLRCGTCFRFPSSQQGLVDVC